MTNGYRKYTVADCTVEVWEAQCKDCQFVTGLARVSHAASRRSELKSGAGCFTRRGPKEVAEWAHSVAEKLSE